MVEIIPAHPGMMLALDVQPFQQITGTELTPAALERLLALGSGYAVVEGPRVLAIGGAYEMWRDRAVAWALLSGRIGPVMPVVHRAVKRWFGVAPWGRIEAHVDPEHAAAVRWMGMLGFEREGSMRRFYAGRDFDLYARVT